MLLGYTARRAFTYTWIFGLVMLFAVLVIPTLSQVFIVAAIIGGGNDALIGLLFLYGKQYWFGFAALGHLASAILVFTQVIRNIGVVPYNALICVSVFAHVGLTVLGIMRTEERFHEYKGPLANPLEATYFRRGVLVRLAIVALIGSTGVTLFLAFVLPHMA